MKRLIVLMTIVGLAPAALAEVVGSTEEGQASFMFTQSKPVTATPVRPVEIAEVVKVKTEVETPEEQVLSAPYQPTLGGTDTRCPDPIAHPQAHNTPVKVYVDQHTQTVEIYTPDRPKPWVSKVSTGGGLKIPNGKLKKSPYCARTPAKDRHIISAVREEMFRGTACTPDEIRAKSTVFPMYHTRTFTDKNGNPVPMPKAVRIEGGIFFHEVPPSYKNMLGHNVSGECVRMTPNTAAFLQAQIIKYGAIEVTMTEAPIVDREMPQYCDEQMVARAQGKGVPSGQIATAPQATGTEDVYGGNDNFFTLIGRALKGRPVVKNNRQQTKQIPSGPGLY